MRRADGEFDEAFIAVARVAWPEDGLVGAWLNNRYSVQHVQRGGLEVLMIRRHDGGASFPWPDLQRIKNEIAGADREAVQVFPRSREVVDSANMAHLWLVPAGDRCRWTFANLERGIG